MAIYTLACEYFTFFIVAHSLRVHMVGVTIFTGFSFSFASKSQIQRIQLITFDNLIALASIRENLSASHQTEPFLLKQI